MIKSSRPCENDNCCVSTFIDEESVTFGSGELNDYGCWEHPCAICALEYLKKNPEAKVLPKVKILKSDSLGNEF